MDGDLDLFLHLLLFLKLQNQSARTPAESQHKDDPDESSSLLSPGRNAGQNAEKQMKIVKGILYAVQVFYSFFIM